MTQAPPSHRRKRVLAVDDEEEILRLYQTFLQYRDYEVITIDNAEDCASFLKTEHADILLLDVNMPGIDGLQLLEMIRTDARLKEMRVIMVSAKRDEETVKKAVKLGCDGFIVKPFKLKDLSERIAMEMMIITEEDIRGFLRGGLHIRTTMFKEPGMNEFSVLQWDPYPLKYQDANICLLVPRGIRPAMFLKAPLEELESKVVVLYRHPQRWKRIWPSARRGQTRSAS